MKKFLEWIGLKVIVFKKLAHGFYLVLPTSTQQRKGSWYVSFRQQGKDMVACLHQVRTIDYRRLWSPLGRIDSDDFARIQEGFWKLYK